MHFYEFFGPSDHHQHETHEVDHDEKDLYEEDEDCFSIQAIQMASID
jgi:hypothetical protein